MPEHRTGTRKEWQAARDELAKLEAEQAERNEEITKRRRELPWVPIEKEYVFETQDGKKTLAELFDGRSQLLAYNVMFGPDYQNGACPGCTSLADGLDGTLIHLNHRDVTLICFSRAPIDRLSAYKQRMGWEFPYVSTYGTDFPWDYQLALTPEQAEQIPEVQEMVDSPPEWLREWSQQVGADLKDGLREAPSFIAFARDNGTVYHTYTVTAPDGSGDRPRLARLVRRGLGDDDGGDDAARGGAYGGRVPPAGGGPRGHPRLRGRLSGRLARRRPVGLRAGRRRSLAGARVPRLGRGGALRGRRRDPRRRAVPADGGERCVAAPLAPPP